MTSETRPAQSEQSRGVLSADAVQSYRTHGAAAVAGMVGTVDALRHVHLRTSSVVARRSAFGWIGRCSAVVQDDGAEYDN